MGDRANIVIEPEGEGSSIYLYSHWGGTDLPETLRRALQRGRDRWDDKPYLTRIIFCEMVKDSGGDLNTLTGLGIDICECDNEHPLIIVNTDSQMVLIAGQHWSFESYVNSEAPDVQKLD